MTTFRISRMAQKYMQRDMIKHYAGLPPFPEARARLLYCFLRENHAEDRELVSLAVSLAQLGLDTHDLVEPVTGAEGTGQARSRQMKVLAGDYFNGHFYQLLSGANRTDIVRCVSRAICEVNRLKMTMYERLLRLRLTAEDYLEQTVAIRSELYVALAKFVPARYADRFPELVRSMTRCEVLCEEIRREGDADMRGSLAYWYMLQTATEEDRDKAQFTDKAGMKTLMHKYRIYPLLADMLQTQIGLIRQFIEQFDSESLRAELHRVLELFTMHRSVPRAAANDEFPQPV